MTGSRPTYAVAACAMLSGTACTSIAGLDDLGFSAASQSATGAGGSTSSAGGGGADASGGGGAGGEGGGPACGDGVLAASLHYTCASHGGGAVHCWGRNADGQLGDGTNAAKLVPVKVVDLASAAWLGMSSYHACARKPDDSVWCWGRNGAGQLGDGTMVGSNVPVEVAIAGVGELVAGEAHTCARKLDGTVWCWGRNDVGQLGVGTSDNSAAPLQVGELGAQVTSISATGWYTCARKDDGTVWCWGENDYGQLGDGTTTSRTKPVQVAALGNDVAAIAAGFRHACAIKSDGALWCWGENLYGEVGDGSGTMQTSPVPVLDQVASVVTHGRFSCARKTDESIWCWGRNANGQLGDGTTTNRPTPVDLTPRLGEFVTLSPGDYHACGRKLDGSLWCWGENDYGELGTGNKQQSLDPVKVSGWCP